MKIRSILRTSFVLLSILNSISFIIYGQAEPAGLAGQPIPLKEHPRPDFQRDEWLNLNGLWDFRFDPKNAGEPINSFGVEMSPFIHPDNQTLYFSSDGHTGMGGLDIFVSRKDST